MPVREAIRALNTRMDRVIGADQLKPSMRSQLLFEQVHAIAQMTPATSAGALAISLMLDSDEPGTSRAPVGHRLERGPLCGLVPGPARLAARQARCPEQDAVDERRPPGFPQRRGHGDGLGLPAHRDAAKRRSGAHGDDGDRRGRRALRIGLCPADTAAGRSRLQRAVAGRVVGCGGRPRQPARRDSHWRRCSPCMRSSLAFVCIRHARNLVHHLVSESKIREQKDIISLLLKEFEENSSDWLWEFDRNGRFQRVSDRFSAASAVSKEQLVGLSFHDFLRSIGQENDPILEELRQDIEKARDLQRRRASGHGRWQRALLAADGKADLRRIRRLCRLYRHGVRRHRREELGTAHQLSRPQ